MSNDFNSLSFCFYPENLSVIFELFQYTASLANTLKYLLVKEKYFFCSWKVSTFLQWRIQGRGQEGPPSARPRPLSFILRPSWGPKGRKNFFLRPASTPLSQGLDDRPPSPPHTRKVDVIEFQVKKSGQSETPTSKTTNKRLLAGTIYIRFLIYLKAIYGQIHFLTPATKLRFCSVFLDRRS